MAPSTAPGRAAAVSGSPLCASAATTELPGARSPAATANAAIISSTDAKRSEGSRAQARWNHASMAVGNQWATLRSCGRGSVQIATSRSPSDSPLNAGCPVSMAYATMPSEYTSVR